MKVQEKAEFARKEACREAQDLVSGTLLPIPYS